MGPLTQIILIYNILNPFSVHLIQGPFYGKAEVVGSSLVYTPNVNFTGIDSLIYTISDFKSQLAYGDVIITVFADVPQFVSNPRVLVGMEDQSVPSQR